MKSKVNWPSTFIDLDEKTGDKIAKTLYKIKRICRTATSLSADGKCLFHVRNSGNITIWKKKEKW